MSEEQKIIAIISTHLGISPTEIELNADLREDLNAQELEITDILMQIEKEFNCQFPPENTKNINTVKDIIDLV